MIIEDVFGSQAECRRPILLVGSGGGFDVFSSLPIYFRVQKTDRHLHLANITLVNNTVSRSGRTVADGCCQIDSDSEGSDYYFPERSLSRWFRSNHQEVPIYCFAMAGVRPVTRAYQTLCNQLNIDTVMLVDAGMDCLMQGDEHGWQSGYEDLANLAAATQLPVSQVLLASVGLGIDAVDGLSHHDVLESMSDVVRRGGFLGAWAWTKDMPEVKQYLDAIDFAHKAMPWSPSTAQSAIRAALHGEFGDVTIEDAPGRPHVWVSPLMSICWLFDARVVAERLPFLDELRKTETADDVQDIIERYRAAVPPRERKAIPL